eukprot:7373946-Prymnesium_polylepis.1
MPACPRPHARHAQPRPVGVWRALTRTAAGWRHILCARDFGKQLCIFYLFVADLFSVTLYVTRHKDSRSV